MEKENKEAWRGSLLLLLIIILFPEIIILFCILRPNTINYHSVIFNCFGLLWFYSLLLFADEEISLHLSCNCYFAQLVCTLRYQSLNTQCNESTTKTCTDGVRLSTLFTVEVHNRLSSHELAPDLPVLPPSRSTAVVLTQAPRLWGIINWEWMIATGVICVIYILAVCNAEWNILHVYVWHKTGFLTIFLSTVPIRKHWYITQHK